MTKVCKIYKVKKEPMKLRTMPRFITILFKMRITITSGHWMVQYRIEYDFAKECGVVCKGQ